MRGRKKALPVKRDYETMREGSSTFAASSLTKEVETLATTALTPGSKLQARQLYKQRIDDHPSLSSETDSLGDHGAATAALS